MDFETYSGAGYTWTEAGKRQSIAGPKKQGGINLVGASAYAEHPTAETLCLAYNLKDGTGPRLWTPSHPDPQDLFDHITAGRLIEAHNTYFEFIIWHYVCNLKMNWPRLPYAQLRDSLAKAQAHAMPAALGKLGPALKLDQVKNKDGARLLNKFSVPRTPTIKQPTRRLMLADDPLDAK